MILIILTLSGNIGTLKEKIVTFFLNVSGIVFGINMCKIIRALRLNQQPSVLDLIMSNEEDMVEGLEYLSPLGASDHKVLTFQFNCYCSHSKNSSTHFNYYKGDYESMRQELKINWEEVLGNNDVNTMLQKFTELIILAKEKFYSKVKAIPPKRNSSSM